MDIFDMAQEQLNKQFVKLNSNCVVRLSSIYAVMILPEDTRKVKIEYGPNIHTIQVDFDTEAEAREYFENIQKLLTQ